MQKIIDYKLNLITWSATNQGEIRKILSDELHLSKREISRLKFDGKIMVGGRQVHVNDHMKVGETLTLVFPEDPKQVTKSLSVVPDILYEDDDEVVVNKPSGIPVHASHTHLDDSMGTILTSYYGARGQNFIVRAVGRLDSVVSGAEIYAKNKPAAARLSKQLEDGKLKKTYTALVSGFFDKPTGTVDKPIAAVPDQRQRITDEEGKPAVTHYTVVKQFVSQGKQISRLQITTETGRTHQIRVHMASIGHPILGDELYGGDMDLMKRTALHCSSLAFRSPFGEEVKTVEAPIPEDMQALIDGRSETVAIVLPEVQKEEKKEPAKPEKKKKTAYVDTFDDDIREKKGIGFFWITFFVLLAALLVLGYGRYRKNQRYIQDRDQALQDAYDQLSITFTDLPAAEYGMAFVPEEYVKEASAPYTAGEINTNKIGRQTVVYTLETVTSFGNEVSREFPLDLEVVDTLPPKIILKETRVEAAAGTRYTLTDNIEAVRDPVDGDLMQATEETAGAYYIDDSEVDITKPGVYVVRIIAIDASGNRAAEEFRLVLTGEEDEEDDKKAEEEKTAASEDKKAPLIMVRYANVDVTAGESYDPRSAVMYVRDDEDGDLVQAETLSEGTYTVETDLDLTKPAVYTVTVTAMDKSKNRSDERFTVSVKQKKDEPEKTAEASPTPSATPTPSASATPAPTATPVPSTQPVTDTKAPVVMVRYANVNIAAGSSYTVGQGIVYIRDETDGDLPYADQLQNGYYTVTTDLDVNTPGTYTVLIRARDRSGNESSEQFTVKVIAPRESSAPTEGGSSGGYVPAANTAAGQIYGYLTGTLGLNRASAFGILAHMQRESGYNPQAYNPSGYYGLCQWGGGRYENLKTWCEGQGLDYKTIDGQLQFMRMELEGSYAGVLADLRSMADSADGAYDAAYAFGMRYEVSGEYLADSAGQTARNMFNQ